MAATGEDDKTKVKDDVSKKEKRFGQKAKQDDDGTKVPKLGGHFEHFLFFLFFFVFLTY